MVMMRIPMALAAVATMPGVGDGAKPGLSSAGVRLFEHGLGTRDGSGSFVLTSLGVG
jgi:hypothetical protein